MTHSTTCQVKMKLAFLGLLATALTISSQDYNSYARQPSKSNSYKNNGYGKDDYGYGEEGYGHDDGDYEHDEDYDYGEADYGYGEDDNYGYKPKPKYPSKDNGYGKAPPPKDGYGKDDGYGKKPTDVYGKDNGYKPKPKPSYGKDDGYGKPPKDGYPTATPGITENPTKKHFDQFYDNLKLCKAESELEQCIFTSPSRRECSSENRINTCTTQFVTGLCGDLSSTVTKSYDNGYFKANTKTCYDAALADSLLVYNKLLRHADNVVALSPKFDSWAFIGIKLALSSTRNHADCVIKGFFNYLQGCAASRVLRTKDKKCLDDSLGKKSCEIYYEKGDGWNLKAFLNRVNSEEFAKVIKFLRSKFGITEEIPVDELLKLVDQTQGVQAVTSSYNFQYRNSSIVAATSVTEDQLLNPLEGTPFDKLVFHFPSTFRTKTEEKTLWSKKKSETEKKTIYEKCDTNFKESQKDLEKVLEEQCISYKTGYIKVRPTIDGYYEVFKVGKEIKTFASDDQKCEKLTADEKKDGSFEHLCDPTYLDKEKTKSDCKKFSEKDLKPIEFPQEKCYSYSGYSIKFLETGEVKPLSLQPGEGGTDDEGNTNVTASWIEPHSCNSHLTQWRQTVTCCKSYYTVLKEFQASWDKNYGRKGGYGPKSEPRGRPERPTEVPSTYNAKKDCVVEKTLISKLTSGPLLSGEHKRTETSDEVINEDETTGTEALDGLLDKFEIQAKAAEKKAKDAANGQTIQIVSNPTVSSFFIGGNKGLKKLCKSLQRGWDEDTVVPIVSAQCFPQACVLSQLAKCLDIPEKETGYDYVAQPQPGYPGYRPSNYIRLTLALESVHTGFLAIAGFAAGASVVVIAQVMLKKKGVFNTSPSSYLLV